MSAEHTGSNTGATVVTEAAKQAEKATHRLDDPLLEALLLLTQLEDRPMTAAGLVAGLPLVGGRLTPELCVRAAARAGLAAKVIERELGAIQGFVLPAILLLKDDTACVLTHIDHQRKEARVLQPESGGEHQVPLDELAALYTGMALFCRSAYRFDDRSTLERISDEGHWFWGTLWKSRYIYRDVLIGALLINIFAIAMPLYTMNVYDRVVANGATATLWALSAGVLLLILFDFILKTLRGYFVETAGKKSDVLLSSRIMEKVLGMRMDVRPASVGAFANNLREFESIRSFFTSATLTALVDLPFAFLFLIVIAYIGKWMVLIPILLLPLIVLYAWAVQGPMRTAIEKSSHATSQKNATLIESLIGLETVKSLGAEGSVQRRWESSTGYIADWGQRTRLLAQSVVNVSYSLQQLVTICMVVLGVYMIIDHELTMGALIACIMLVNRVTAPLSQAAGLLNGYYQARTALDTLERIMALPSDRNDETQYVSRQHFQGDIEFRNVSFSYPGQEQEALSQISFHIKAGERVGILGRIGSGKSSLAKLITGLHQPGTGAILIDGIDNQQLDPADMRRDIGYVPQEVILFYGNVRENIAYGIPHVDDYKLVRAAEAAGVLEFVNRHPRGFDLPVGEFGRSLSGGQRQAVAVARTFLHFPAIYVMDEPSNGMDNRTEEQLKLNLLRRTQGKTFILVTHRSSMLNLIDRLLVLDNGRLLADGPRDAVLEALKQGKIRTEGIA